MEKILEKIRSAKQVLECGYDIDENSLKESDAYDYLTEAELLCGQFEQRVIKSEAFVPSNATVAELTDKINNVRQFLGKTFALSNDYADEKNLKILEAEKRLKKIVDELSNRSL